MTEISDKNIQWDALCKQCGSCCFEKFEDDQGNILYTQTACRYLDVVTRRCRIFERRFEINPRCLKLTPELVPTLRWLPPDCGYLQPSDRRAVKNKNNCSEKKRGEGRRKRKQTGRTPESENTQT